MNRPEKKARTRGWVGGLAARADQILTDCRRLQGTSVAAARELRDALFEIADEVVRLHRVVENQSRQITELRQSKRPNTDTKTTGPAS